MSDSLFASRLFGWLFERLDAIDGWFHDRGLHPNPVCRIVGAMERPYYDARTDWAHPLWEKPSGEWTPENRRRANRRLLDALATLWDEVPDQRFGQLVMNLSRTEDGFADTWNWSHQKWHEVMGEACLIAGRTPRFEARCAAPLVGATPSCACPSTARSAKGRWAPPEVQHKH